MTFIIDCPGMNMNRFSAFTSSSRLSSLNLSYCGLVVDTLLGITILNIPFNLVQQDHYTLSPLLWQLSCPKNDINNPIWPLHTYLACVLPHFDQDLIWLNRSYTSKKLPSEALQTLAPIVPKIPTMWNVQASLTQYFLFPTPFKS